MAWHCSTELGNVCYGMNDIMLTSIALHDDKRALTHETHTLTVYSADVSIQPSHCVPQHVMSSFTANLRTKIMDFRGFGSIVILMLRGVIFMSIPESLSQRILVGTIFVGGLGVPLAAPKCPLPRMNPGLAFVLAELLEVYNLHLLQLILRSARARAYDDRA